MPRRGLPDRWLDYSHCGKVIRGTRFIAFKVPLKQHYCDKLPAKDRWTPETLLQDVPNLGIIIDFTNTTRYYNPEVFTEKKIQYVKIFCPGHGVLPKAENFDMFFNAVNSFLNDRRCTEKLVGVHCTHGLNRTGLFICKYMIDHLGFSAKDAISAFNDARGHPIEREEYLSALTGVLDVPPAHPKSSMESSRANDLQQRLLNDNMWNGKAGQSQLDTKNSQWNSCDYQNQAHGRNSVQTTNYVPDTQAWQVRRLWTSFDVGREEHYKDINSSGTRPTWGQMAERNLMNASEFQREPRNPSNYTARDNTKATQFWEAQDRHNQKREHTYSVSKEQRSRDSFQSPDVARWRSLEEDVSSRLRVEDFGKSSSPRSLPYNKRPQADQRLTRNRTFTSSTTSPFTGMDSIQSTDSYSEFRLNEARLQSRNMSTPVYHERIPEQESRSNSYSIRGHQRSSYRRSYTPFRRSL